MMIDFSIAFLACFCGLSLVESKEDYAFECKPKYGCNLGSCVDIPIILRSLSGFDEDYYRKKMNYHLECRPKDEIGKLSENMEFVSVEMFNSFKEEVRSDIEKLQRKVEELKKVAMQETNDVAPKMTSDETTAKCAGLTYQCKCFTLIGKELVYGRDHFEEACSKTGGHLANLYDSQHYLKLASHVRQRVENKSGSVVVFLGMKYSFVDGGPVFYNDDAATFEMPWVSGFPKDNDDSDAMLMYVDVDPTKEFQGIFNFVSTNPQLYAMCERDL